MSLDRYVIKEKEPFGLESIFLNQWWSWASKWEEDKEPAHYFLANKGGATFITGRGDFERLIRCVLTQCMKESETEQTRASTFVVTCALVWTCLIKAQEHSGSRKHEDDELYYCFVADRRNRPELAIPEMYADFGWGKPKKTEVLQTDVSAATYLGECRDEEGLKGNVIGFQAHSNFMDQYSAE
ncbi:hypothetical protein REPUB_Repub01dG0137500 [Reevesia pubescens]